MKIMLSDEEILICLDEAMRREQVGPMRTNKEFRIHPDNTRIQQVGVITEAAVRKAFGMGVNNVRDGYDNHKAGDIVINSRAIEVRGTELKSGRLVVAGYDPDDRAFVLVRMESERWCDIIGWNIGRDSKNPLWLKRVSATREVYFVPNEKLRPFEELMEIVRS
jgi:hypothetical protein